MILRGKTGTITGARVDLDANGALVRGRCERRKGEVASWVARGLQGGCKGVESAEGDLGEGRVGKGGEGGGGGVLKRE